MKEVGKGAREGASAFDIWDTRLSPHPTGSKTEGSTCSRKQHA